MLHMLQWINIVDNVTNTIQKPVVWTRVFIYQFGTHHGGCAVYTTSKSLYGSEICSYGVKWPPRSPDMSPCDFCLWGYLKLRVYRTPPTSIQDLRRRIEREVQCITWQRERIAASLSKVIKWKGELQESELFLETFKNWHIILCTVMMKTRNDLNPNRLGFWHWLHLILLDIVQVFWNYHLWYCAIF